MSNKKEIPKSLIAFGIGAVWAIQNLVVKHKIDYLIVGVFIAIGFYLKYQEN